MPIARNRLDIETERTEFKSLKHLVPVELFFAAGIKDGEGDASDRLMVRIKGDKQFYFLFAKGTETSMRKPSPWLQKELEMRANSNKKPAIPDDMGKPVPVKNLAE